MTRLTKFGADASGGSFARQWTFTVHQTQYNDNFGNTKSRVSTAPGLDGGFDQFGPKRFAHSVGNVRQTLILHDDGQDSTLMTGLRDAVRRAQDWGRQPLFMQPSDSTDPIRFCMAKLDNVQIPEARHLHADLVQPVVLIFNVNDPRWMSLPDADAVYWDDGSTWDPGEDWEEPRYTSSTVATGAAISLTNNGTAATPIRIKVTAGAGPTTSIGFELENIENGATLTGFLYTKALASGDELVIDSNFDPTVRHNGASDYANFEPVAGSGFIMLPPGTHTINVTGVYTGNHTVDIEYFDSWR